MKCFDDIRKPVCCHTGKGPDADYSRLKTVEFSNFPLQLIIFLADTLCTGQELQSIRSQPHAVSSPFQKRDAPFSLQILNHPADPRLRIMQLLCSFGEASIFNCFDKGPVFLKIHIHRRFPPIASGFIILSMLNILFCNLQIDDTLCLSCFQEKS